MKVHVDRFNGTLSITLGAEPAVRTVAFEPDVSARLDRYGRLQRLDLAHPLAQKIRQQVLPRLAAQFHVPELARLDPGLLLGGRARHN